MHKLIVCIPTYNNEKSIASVVKGVLAHVPEVMVVNDGSTDSTEERAREAGARIVRHEKNRGKGEALKTGLRAAAREGYTHVLTIDGDGQHEPKDIPSLIEASQKAPAAIVLGLRDLAKMPEKNRFGNRFSNFWVNLAMGSAFTDTQCGLRVYPAGIADAHRFRGAGYEFETEVLIRQARDELPIVGHPVEVYYPPAEERVSHFVPWRDARRIVLLVMRFLFLPRMLWALLLFASCAPAVSASNPTGRVDTTRAFSAKQTLRFDDGKDKRTASGLFIVYPGSAYRLRVLGPMMVTAFDVSVRCGKFVLDARDKSAKGTLAEAKELVRFFPVAELFEATSPAQKRTVGEMTVDVVEETVVDGVTMPKKLHVDIGHRVRLDIENEEISFDVPPENEAVGEIQCDS